MTNQPSTVFTAIPQALTTVGELRLVVECQLIVLVDVLGEYCQPSIRGLPLLQVFSPLRPRQGQDGRDEESDPCERGGDQGCPHIALPPVDKGSIRHAGSYDDECAEDQ